MIGHAPPHLLRASRTAWSASREKERRPLRQRQQGDQPDRDRAGARRVRQIRWICGGLAKTDNLDECAPHFGHVREAYTIGEAGELFAQLLVAAHDGGRVR